MTASQHDIPEDQPTYPTPVQSGEARILRHMIDKVGSDVLAGHEEIRKALATMRLGLQIELQGIKYEIESLKNKSEDTGRHLIITDQAVGRAEGKADAALRSRRDSDPVRAFAVVVVTAVAKRVPIWAWPLLSALAVLVFHKLGWLESLAWLRPLLSPHQGVSP